MANKYYNKEYLPILPTIDSTIYPYLLLGKGADGSYILLASSTSNMDYYPTSKKALVVGADCVLITHTLENASAEWSVASDQTSVTDGTSLPIDPYEIFWANFSFWDYDNYNINDYENMIPVDFYWNAQEAGLDNSIEVDLGDGDFIYLCKISDNIFTYDQLLTISGYESFQLEINISDLDIINLL